MGRRPFSMQLLLGLLLLIVLSNSSVITTDDYYNEQQQHYNESYHHPASSAAALYWKTSTAHCPTAKYHWAKHCDYTLVLPAVITLGMYESTIPCCYVMITANSNNPITAIYDSFIIDDNNS